MGGLIPKQTQNKTQIAFFDPNFTLRVSKSHKKPWLGSNIWESLEKRFGEPSLKGNVLTCVITSSSLFPASSLLRIHGKWTIILVKLSELPLLEVIDY